MMCIFIDLFYCVGMSLLNERALVVGIGEPLKMILHSETVFSIFVSLFPLAFTY